PNLVLPRDRVLPFLGGPLLRSSAIHPIYGVIVALSGSPIEVVVATDVSVRYLQTSLEPRFVFRVSERIALRIKDDAAIGILRRTSAGPSKPLPVDKGVVGLLAALGGPNPKSGAYLGTGGEDALAYVADLKAI
ncbi:MAG TPA: hypothetical protein VHV30_06870, partial [Polyangiaceae bacterium]|nr:hypothetical protein [Polyangiaceae bacterium]